MSLALPMTSRPSGSRTGDNTAEACFTYAPYVLFRLYPATSADAVAAAGDIAASVPMSPCDDVGEVAARYLIIRHCGQSI